MTLFFSTSLEKFALWEGEVLWVGAAGGSVQNLWVLQPLQVLLLPSLYATMQQRVLGDESLLWKELVCGAELLSSGYRSVYYYGRCLMLHYSMCSF